LSIQRSVHPLPGESERRERLLTLLDGFSGRRVAVIGDLIADEFIYGRVARVSREAPVLILHYDSTEILPGGAGNAANNVAALGARTHLIAIAGKDEPGKRLASSLRQVDTRGLLRLNGYCTPVKTRILAGGVHTAKQQIVRIDRVVSTDYDASSRAAFARAAVKPRRNATPSAVGLRHGLNPSSPVRSPKLPAGRGGVRADSHRLGRPAALSRLTAYAERIESAASRRANRRQHQVAGACGPEAAAAYPDGCRPHHAGQPRDGGLRARTADDSRADFRLR
jgi:hypothetical protein